MLKSKKYLMVLLLIVFAFQSMSPVVASLRVDPEDLKLMGPSEPAQEVVVHIELQSDGSYNFIIPIKYAYNDAHSISRPGVTAGGGYGQVWGSYWPESGFLEIGTTTTGVPLIKSIYVSLDLSGSVRPRTINQSRSVFVPSSRITTDGQYHIGTPIANVPHGMIRVSMYGIVNTVFGSSYISSFGVLNF